MNLMEELRPPRVLIVDDEPINVQVLAEALAGVCDLRFTTRPADVQRLTAELQIDLILLDLQMPGMSGFQVLTALQADPLCRSVPVIIVTAMGELDDEEAGLNAGAVDYITKPISPAIVRARVRTHLELKRQRDQLAALAGSDGLTGIANRRRFDEQFELRWRQALRHGHGLTVMLADVDHFKQYNDHYGHGPGDDCLRQIAAALQRALGRADDLVARYGGEEFAVLCAVGDAEATLRRALQSVQALQLPHARSPVRSTVSLSIGAVALDAALDLKPEEVLALADQLLYQAKHGGRDRALLRRLPEEQPTLILFEGSAP